MKKVYEEYSKICRIEYIYKFSYLIFLKESLKIQIQIFFRFQLTYEMKFRKPFMDLWHRIYKFKMNNKLLCTSDHFHRVFPFSAHCILWDFSITFFGLVFCPNYLCLYTMHFSMKFHILKVSKTHTICYCHSSKITFVMSVTKHDIMIS